MDAGSFPDRLAAIRQARDTRKVARTSPLRLVQAPGENAILLYGPVFAKDGKFLGVIGFGYKVEELFQTALTNPKSHRDFSIRVKTENVDAPLYVLNGDERRAPSADPRNPQRPTSAAACNFGGRAADIHLCRCARSCRRSLASRFVDFLAGLAFTAAAVSFLALDRQPRRRARARSRLAPVGGRAAENADPRIEPSRPQCDVGRASRRAAELHVGDRALPTCRRPAKDGCRRWPMPCRCSPRATGKA